MQTQPQPPADQPLPLRWTNSDPSQVRISADGLTASLRAVDNTVCALLKVVQTDAILLPVAQRLRLRVRHQSGGRVRAALVLDQKGSSSLFNWADGDLLSESKQLVEGQRWDEADRDYELQVSGREQRPPQLPPFRPRPQLQPSPARLLADSLAPADCHRLRLLVRADAAAFAGGGGLGQSRRPLVGGRRLCGRGGRAR